MMMNRRKISLSLFSLLALSQCTHAMIHAQRQQQESEKTSTSSVSAKKDALYATSIAKQVSDRAKEQYAKSKPHPIKEAISKFNAPNEGLLGTTYVKTDTGYRKMEDLKKGDTVSCYDFKTGKKQPAQSHMLIEKNCQNIFRY